MRKSRPGWMDFLKRIRRKFKFGVAVHGAGKADYRSFPSPSYDGCEIHPYGARRFGTAFSMGFKCIYVITHGMCSAARRTDTMEWKTSIYQKSHVNYSELAKGWGNFVSYRSIVSLYILSVLQVLADSPSQDIFQDTGTHPEGTADANLVCVKMFSVMLISEAITFCGLLVAA